MKLIYPSILKPQRTYNLKKSYYTHEEKLTYKKNNGI